MDGKWAISQNTEDYRGSFNTKEEAIAEARAMWPGDDFDVAQCNSVPIVIDGNCIIEQAIEHACEAAGEHAEDWLDCASKEQVAELTDTLTVTFDAWVAKHGFQQTFYTIDSATVESHAGSTTPPKEG